MRHKTHTRTFQFLMSMVLIASLTSCEKEIVADLPGDGKECYVNFYNAAEAIVQAGNQELYKLNMVYVNDSLNTDFTLNNNFYTAPQFSDNGGMIDGRQYPETYSGNILYRTTNWSGGTSIYNDVYWQSLDAADFYRFIFTSVDKTYLKDIRISLNPKTFTSFYLTESPESDDAYTIVPAPVELQGVEGKVKVQIVNLVPDWQAIDVVTVGDDGNTLASDLPSNLKFGTYSPYTELDVAQANEQKKLIIKIKQSGDTDFDLSTAIDAVSGSVYTIVVKGFANETVRYIKKSNTENARVQVMPGLRTHNRRVY